MTAVERTASLLRPWLGSAFVAAQADLVERLAIKLGQFVPGRDILARVAQEVDSQLFMAVRDVTGGRMIVQLDDGNHMRLRLNDFELMADELLWLLLEALPVNEDNYLLIREHSIRQGSLAALKALYLLYQGFQTPEEYSTVIRIIKTCHPPFRWRQWL